MDAALAQDRFDRLPERQRVLIQALHLQDGYEADGVHTDQLREVLPFLQRFGAALDLEGVCDAVTATLAERVAPEGATGGDDAHGTTDGEPHGDDEGDGGEEAPPAEDQPAESREGDGG